jgi:hypothetical protein
LKTLHLKWASVTERRNTKMALGSSRNNLLWRNRETCGPLDQLHRKNSAITQKNKTDLASVIRPILPKLAYNETLFSLGLSLLLITTADWGMHLSDSKLLMNSIIKGSEDGVLQSGLLSFWTLSIVWYYKNTRRFENWLCFRPQV